MPYFSQVFGFFSGIFCLYATTMGIFSKGPRNPRKMTTQARIALENGCIFWKSPFLGDVMSTLDSVVRRKVKFWSLSIDIPHGITPFIEVLVSKSQSWYDGYYDYVNIPTYISHAIHIQRPICKSWWVGVQSRKRFGFCMSQLMIKLWLINQPPQRSAPEIRGLVDQPLSNSDSVQILTVNTHSPKDAIKFCPTVKPIETKWPIFCRFDPW